MGRKLAPKAVPYAKRDGTTSWRVRIRVAGRQTTETFDTEVAANVFIARCLDPNVGPDRAVAMRDREDTNSSGYVPTIREALERHLSTLTGVERATVSDYRKIAGRSWLPLLGGLRVDELDRADVARWLNVASGAPKTIRNAHSVLVSTLTTATYDGHIAVNVAKGIRLPRAGEEDEEDPQFLTYAEFDHFYSQFRPEAQPIVAWMFGMGTRFGETTALQQRDINLAAGQQLGNEWVSTPTARVVRAWKKGRVLGPPKSKAGRRTIVMPPEVVDVVAPLLTGEPDRWLFPTSTGKALTHGNFFNRVWKPATLRASICPDHRPAGCRCFSGKPHLCRVHVARDENGHTVLPRPCGCAGTLSFRPNIHAARHTHASWLIHQGAGLDLVQDRLGHEDYLTTKRLYGHLLPDARVDAAAAASLAFAATSLRGLPAGSPRG